MQNKQQKKLAGWRYRTDKSPLDCLWYIQEHVKKKKRNFIPKGISYYSDAKKLAQDKNIDLVIELIGGSEGIAKDVCYIAIKNNKHLITSKLYDFKLKLAFPSPTGYQFLQNA